MAKIKDFKGPIVNTSLGPIVTKTVEEVYKNLCNLIETCSNRNCISREAVIECGIDPKGCQQFYFLDILIETGVDYHLDKVAPTDPMIRPAICLYPDLYTYFFDTLAGVKNI